MLDDWLLYPAIRIISDVVIRYNVLPPISFRYNKKMRPLNTWTDAHLESVKNPLLFKTQ